MAAAPLQSMQITMATNQFVGRQMFDATVKYPFAATSIDFASGMMPRSVLVKLADQSLTFDECLELFDAIRSRLRELGVKPTDELDIQYCCLLSEEGATKAQFIFSYPI